jgi:hypothetical protein
VFVRRIVMPLASRVRVVTHFSYRPTLLTNAVIMHFNFPRNSVQLSKNSKGEWDPRHLDNWASLDHLLGGFVGIFLEVLNEQAA